MESEKRRIVFLVKDLIFRSKIRESLSDRPIDLVFVKDGPSLVQKVREENVSMVAIDVNLLGDSVGGLIKEAKELQNDLPIVGFCSHVDKDLFEAATNAGVSKVLPRSKFFIDVDTWLKYAE